MKQIRSTAVNKQMSDDELEEKLSHPVTVLRLVTELYAETESVRLALQPSELPEGTHIRYLEKRGWNDTSLCMV